MALAAAILAIPRAVPPRELPLPSVDRIEQRTAEERDRQRIREATAEPLPFVIRAAGEAFRRLGAAELRGDEIGAGVQRAAFVQRLADARHRYGDEPLLALESLQASLFVAAARRREPPTPEPRRDVEELGGKFWRLAIDSGWLAEGRVLIEDDALSTLFKVRWANLAGLLDTYPFAPSLNGWRIYYRTLLLHPEHRRDPDPLLPSQADLLTRYVEALSKQDPDYPALLARGILEHWLHDYAGAERLLSAHLNQHPFGPWRLRSQNYLLAARRHVPGPLLDP